MVVQQCAQTRQRLRGAELRKRLGREDAYRRVAVAQSLNQRPVVRGLFRSGDFSLRFDREAAFNSLRLHFPFFIAPCASAVLLITFD